MTNASNATVMFSQFAGKVGADPTTNPRNMFYDDHEHYTGDCDHDIAIIT